MTKLKLILFGVISWLVPFVASFFLYSKDGQLLVSPGLFNCIMVVVGIATGSYLLVLLFKRVDGDYLRWGIKAGVTWLLINIILDFAILLPMSKMSLGTYFTEVALEYLSIPIMSIAMGYVLSKKVARGI